MLQAPAPGDHLGSGALAYWSSLLHLLVYGFGWSQPGRGLRWWYGAGKPVDDPRLALISEVWDADGQLDWFAAWLWTTGACCYLYRPIGFAEESPVEVDSDWLERVESRIAESQIPSPYGGGSTASPTPASTNTGSISVSPWALSMPGAAMPSASSSKRGRERPTPR